MPMTLSKQTHLIRNSFRNLHQRADQIQLNDDISTERNPQKNRQNKPQKSLTL
jgi:hypothetical protein